MLYQRYFLRMNQSNTTHILTLLLALVLSLAAVHIILIPIDTTNNLYKNLHRNRNNNNSNNSSTTNSNNSDNNRNNDNYYFHYANSNNNTISNSILLQNISLINLENVTNHNLRYQSDWRNNIKLNSNESNATTNIDFDGKLYNRTNEMIKLNNNNDNNTNINMNSDSKRSKYKRNHSKNSDIANENLVNFISNIQLKDYNYGGTGKKKKRFLIPFAQHTIPKKSQRKQFKRYETTRIYIIIF